MVMGLVVYVCMLVLTISEYQQKTNIFLHLFEGVYLWYAVIWR